MVHESRPLDHAYDPVYSRSTLTQPLQQVHYASKNLYRRPGWDNSIQHTLPSSSSTTTAAAAATVAVGGKSDASTQLSQQQLHQLHHPSHYNYNQALEFSHQHHLQSIKQSSQQLQIEVMGKDRSKYFKRPVIPFIQPSAGDSLLQSQIQSELSSNVGNEVASSSSQQQQQQQSIDQLTQSTTRTIAIQTDYREQETQTDPYTPDYVTAPDDDEPEILSIAHLKYGQGLPASLTEIKEIEKLRNKKEFELSLPSLSCII